MMNVIKKLFSDRFKLKSVFTLSAYVGLMVVAAIVFSKYADRESLQAVVNNSGAFGGGSYFLI